MNEPQALFVEEIALHWEQFGLPRIAGRILGLLLCCDPPHRSSAQLAEELGASRASISSMTRLLLAATNIETVAIPGERSTFYRLSQDSFEKRFVQKVSMMIGFREIVERGMVTMGGAPSHTAAMREQVAMCAFLERELPLLFERWRAERDA